MSISVSVALRETPAYTVKLRIVGYKHLLYTACLITTQLSLVLIAPHCTHDRQSANAGCRLSEWC